MADSQSHDNERLSWWQVIRSCSGTAIDKRNQLVFVAWSFAWAITYVGVSRLLGSDSGVNGTMAWLLAGIPIAISIVACLAYLRFLRMADELMQKIQMEGLATGFAAGLVFILGYQVLERAGAPVLDNDSTLQVMCAAWAAGQFIGVWRYR